MLDSARFFRRIMHPRNRNTIGQIIPICTSQTWAALELSKTKQPHDVRTYVHTYVRRRCNHEHSSNHYSRPYVRSNTTIHAPAVPKTVQRAPLDVQVPPSNSDSPAYCLWGQHLVHRPSKHPHGRTGPWTWRGGPSGATATGAVLLTSSVTLNPHVLILTYVLIVSQQ